MATETIREFLVALGYKQDEAALKKFEKGITQATKAVFSLAAAVEGTAVLVAAGIAKFASNLEALYFASQRVGISVTNLKAFDRAAQDFGTSAGEMQASLEGLAHQLRINPQGMGGLLHALGVDLKSTKDGSHITAQSIIQLSDALRKMPIQRAEAYLPLLGIDEKTLLALRDPNFVEQYRKTLALMRGADWEQAARDAHEFENQIRDLWTLIESIGIKVGNNLAKDFGFQDVKDFNAWLQAHSDEIAKRVTDAIETILRAAKWLGDKLIWLKDKFADLDTATDGWSTKLILIAAVLKVTGAGSLIGGVLSLGAAAATASGGLVPFAAVISATAAALTGLYAAYKAFKGEDAGNWISEGFNDIWSKAFGGRDLAESLANMTNPLSGPTKGVRLNNPGNLRFRGQSGARDNAGFAQWQSPGEGLYALGRQLELYSGRGMNSVGSILKKYAPASENNLKAYIADVTGRMGVGADAQLNLQDPATLSKLMSAIIGHEQGYNPYASSMVSGAANKAIQITAKTEIHVNGVGDPAAVSDRVTAAQKRVNQDLARSFAPTVQ